jgi:cob(I)alamin adenosyltransferase
MTRTMMSITTKTGDKGKTALFSGQMVDKDSPRTDAYGDVDELVSVLGVARAHAEREQTLELLLWLQVELFVVATELATEREQLALVRERIGADRVAALDAKRDWLEENITMPGGFIIPGGTRAAAFIDHARTISRRVERRVVGLTRDGLVENADLLIWLNRLSDFLWLLARYEEGDATMLKP